MKTLYRFVSGNLEAVGPREFRGIAATVGLKDDGVDLVMAGADLSRLQRGAPLLFQHDPEHILGRIVSARATASALPFTAAFADAGISHHIDEKCALLKSGVLNSISLGFTIDEGEPIKGGSRRGIRAVRWTALEISLVAVPVDTGAVVTSRARRSGRVLSKLHHEKLSGARDAIDEVICAAEDADPRLAAADDDDASSARSADYRKRQAELLTLGAPELISPRDYARDHSFEARQADLACLTPKR